MFGIGGGDDVSRRTDVLRRPSQKKHRYYCRRIEWRLSRSSNLIASLEDGRGGALGLGLKECIAGDLVETDACDVLCRLL